MTSAGGLDGRLLRYEVHRDGRLHRYWATVFVTSRWVYVVEAVGDHELFDPAEEVLAQTICTHGPS